MNAVIAICKSAKQSLVEHEGIPEHDIQVIYNGMKAVPARSTERQQRLKQELGISEGDFIFGTIARLDTIKN